MSRPVLSLIVVTLFLATGRAQTANVSTEHAPASEQTAANTVQVSFVVTDHHGKPVTDLTKEKLSILDNSQPPEKIVSFQSAMALPLRLALLIDSSNSMRSSMPAIQKASQAFLRELIRPGLDKAMVMAFDEVSTITADFTDNQTKLASGINQIQARGGTAMWDAVDYACRDKLMKESASTVSRSAIVVVSDGDDNQSRVKREEAIQMAQRAGVVVYVVSPGGGSPYSSSDLGDANIRRLSEGTGGRAFYPGGTKGMQSNFATIVEELSAQYLVSYVPASLQHDGRFRSIKIEVEDKKLKVHVRKGYPAPTD